MCLLAAVALVGCRDGDRAPSSEAPPTAPSSPTTADAECALPHPAGQSTESFDFEGVSRTYELYVPESYDGTRPLPLILNFHGYGSNAVQQMFYGDFKPIADRDSFLVVAPDGQGSPLHFNLVGAAGEQDDIAMSIALLDRLEQTLCVDPDRVYSTGMSNGGAVTSFLACRHPDRFGAFAPVALVLHVPGCVGTEPVAMVAFMGTHDPIVPFDGGQVSCCGSPILGSAPGAVADWASASDCDAGYTDERLDTEVRRRTWTGCEGTAEVVFYIIDGGGHTWPGAIAVPGLGLTTQQVDASETIWEFFQAHPRAG